ncbi:hypothetical protein ACFC00_20430 [Streptomyces adustus]|uniref:hypothetical protein n=1 Tax=Streptomyces adustus TaxID=1609272 RepID=UPI0035DB92FC
MTGQIDARRRPSEAEVLERIRTPQVPAVLPTLRVRSLAEVERDGDDDMHRLHRFVETFVNGLHGGDQDRAKDHWTGTGFSARQAFQQQEGADGDHHGTAGAGDRSRRRTRKGPMPTCRRDLDHR